MFLATAPTGEKVVVKFVQLDYPWLGNGTIMRNKEVETRANREIELIKEYSSPYLPRLYDSAPQDVVIGQLTYKCYVEYYAGEESVAEMIQNGAVPESEVLKMLTHVTSALELYSGDKVVHRDVKPQNIIHDITNDRYVLIDGGVHIAPYHDTITYGYVPGTEAYYSPEQAGGQRRSLDSRSDLFSLGITAYEALTTKHPFGIGARTMDDFNNNRANAIYPKIGAGIFKTTTTTVIHKLLERYPHNRYRNPATLLLELEEEQEE